MPRIFFALICIAFTLPRAFCQQRKPVPKIIIRQTGSPVFNVKDDPSPVKYIQLKNDTPVYYPTYFYIQKVVDKSVNADSIGFFLQPKSGLKQRAAFNNGTAKAVETYLDFKVAKDTTLYPLLFTINNLSIAEDAEKDYRNGVYRYDFSLSYEAKDKPLAIGHYDGRYSYTVHVTQRRNLDSIIATTLGSHMNEIDTVLEETINNHPAFCKGVNTLVNLKTINPPEGDTIFYDGHRELNWEDFASLSPGADNYFLGVIGVFINPEIDYKDAKVQFKIETDSYFVRSYSWAGKKIKTSALLYHLNYRFKLCWLASLKFKKKIEATTFSCTGYQQEFRELFSTATRQLQKLLEEFSAQTATGSNKGEQIRWQHLIDSQIEEFEK
jgi:hypothetical protein